jgi:hypothetical protein
VVAALFYGLRNNYSLVNSHQSGLHLTPNKGVECAGERDAEPRAEKNSHDTAHDTALMMMKKFLGDEFSANGIATDKICERNQ